MTQKINWTNVGKGVAYFIMGVGSVCGINASIQGEATKATEGSAKYVTIEEFRTHESVDSVNSLNETDRLNEIKALLINISDNSNKTAVDIAVLRERIEELRSQKHRGY